jgi:glucuronoarabinoxylan endo-1,4-beta-xylanase
MILAAMAMTACNDEDVQTLPVPDEIPATLTIQPDITYQTVKGFGVMETSWQQSALTDDELSTLYGTADGQLGCNILRVRIAPKDASQDAAKRWGTVAAVVKKAKALGATILASPWTPPAALKNNNNIVGGSLSDYKGYADYLVEFLDYMKSQDATVDAISIQNEPDFEASYEGCLWTGLQQASFFSQYGAAIKAAHPEVKLMSGESYQFRHESTDPILENSAACNAVDIIGGHIYGGGNTAYDLADAKGKERWMTEHLLNEAWDKSSPYKLTGDVRAETLSIANEINTSMNSGITAYIYWYGRRYYSMLGDGLAGSTMSAVTPRGYIYSQIAKALTGKTRVKVVSSKNVSTDVNTSAYTDSKGNITMLFVNTTSADITGLHLSLPFTPSSTKMITSTITTTAFPTATDNFLVESKPDLTEGLTLKAYSVITVTLNK